MAEAQARLRVALERRERAVTSEIEGLRARAEVADAPREAIPVRLPGEDPAPEVERARVEASQRRLREAAAGREERLLRGAVGSYRADAEVVWERESLAALARYLGLPDGVVPANEFTLLDRDTLSDLSHRWEARHAALQQAAAARPDGALQVAIQQAEARLVKIREALAAPGTDLTTRFFHRPRSDLGAGDPPPGWQARLAGRESAIRQRELDLLRRASARDGTDVAVLLRMEELEGAEGSLAERVGRLRRALAVERARALRTTEMAAAQAPDVVELFRNRIADPVLAVEREAALRLQWQELRGIPDPAARARVLQGGLASSFPDWLASQLAYEDLLEVRAHLTRARTRLEVIDQANPIELQARLDIDRHILDAETRAVDREIRHWEAHGRGRAPDVDVATLPPTARAVVERHATQGGRLLDTPPGRQARWESMQLYLARVRVPSAEAARQADALAIQGYEEAITELERDATRYRQWADRYSRDGLTALTTEERNAQLAALQSLGERTERIRAGVNGLHQVEVSAKRRVLARLIVVMPTGRVVVNNNATRDGPPGDFWGGWPRPPPEPPTPPEPPAPSPAPNEPPRSPGGGGGAVAARPFGDAGLYEQGQTFAARMTVLERTPPGRVAPTTQVAGGRPVVLVETESGSRQRLAPGGERPVLEGWRIENNSRVPRYEEIDTLRSVDILPGGVAFGRQAQVDGDWSQAVLTYVARERRLVLVTPDGAAVRFEEVAPEVLWACYQFARDTDTVAVSIGRGPGDTGLAWLRSEPDRIRLHPRLRDTQVGRDVIDADMLPWSLGDARLPNGAPTPPVIRTQMQTRIEAAGRPPAQPLQELLNRLGGVAGVDVNGPARPQRAALRAAALGFSDQTVADLLVRAVLQAPNRASRVAEFRSLTAGLTISTDPEPVLLGLPGDPGAAAQVLVVAHFAQAEDLRWDDLLRGTLILAAASLDDTATVRDAARGVIGLMTGTRLSLLTDDRVRFTRSGEELRGDVSVRLRYVRNRVEVNSTGLRRTDQAEVDADASTQGTTLLPDLERVYPALRGLREAMGWTSLMRWALARGNVRSLDLSDLADLRPARVPTPDFLCRGSQAQRQRCLRELGM